MSEPELPLFKQDLDFVRDAAIQFARFEALLRARLASTYPNDTDAERESRLRKLVGRFMQHARAFGDEAGAKYWLAEKVEAPEPEMVALARTLNRESSS